MPYAHIHLPTIIPQLLNKSHWKKKEAKLFIKSV